MALLVALLACGIGRVAASECHWLQGDAARAAGTVSLPLSAAGAHQTPRVNEQTRKEALETVTVLSKSQARSVRSFSAEIVRSMAERARLGIKSPSPYQSASAAASQQQNVPEPTSGLLLALGLSALALRRRTR